MFPNGVAPRPPQWLIVDLATGDKPTNAAEPQRRHLSLVGSQPVEGDTSQMNYVRAGFDKEIERKGDATRRLTS